MTGSVPLPPDARSLALPLPVGPSDLSGYDVLIGDVGPFKVNFKGLPCTVPTGQLLQSLLQALVPLVHG